MKHTIVIASILFALTGCAGIMEGIAAASGHPRCPINTTVTPVSEAVLRQAWVDQFKKPLPATCDARWSWYIVAPEQQDKVCNHLTAAGCTIYVHGPNGTTSPGCPITYTTAKYAGDTRLAAHEIAHWLLHCTTGTTDPKHLNPAVWGEGGFVLGIVARFPPK